MAKSFQKCGEVSSGAFIASFVSNSVAIGGGATGTFATITPPAGERVKLTGLTASAAQSNLTTVTVGGVDKVQGVLLQSINVVAAVTGRFNLGFGASSQESFIGETDEAFELKTNVALSSDTVYAYQFGE